MPAKSSTSRLTPKPTRKSPRLARTEATIAATSDDINYSSGSENDYDEDGYSSEERGSPEKSPVRSRRPIRSPKSLPEKNFKPVSIDTHKKKLNIPHGFTSSEKCSETFQIQAFFQQNWYFLLGVLVVGIVSFFGQSYLSNPKLPAVTLDSIKEKFPNQIDSLWKAISSGLNETVTFKHPTSYVFLHDDQTEKIASDLVRKLSEYAVCQLSNCDNSPINFTEVLKSNESDYGWLITKYKPELQNSGVMIVENLDEVPGKFALAFHSFCDEISPLVEKSAFFFTMKVDKFMPKPLMDVKYIEEKLRDKWEGIEDDQFGPLLTRITSIILRIRPEDGSFHY